MEEWETSEFFGGEELAMLEEFDRELGVVESEVDFDYGDD